LLDAQQNPASALSSLLRLVTRVIGPLTLIVFAAPLLATVFYSVPATDDFCKATLSFNGVPQSGVLHITWLYYTQWSPRWLTTLLQSFAMSHINLTSGYSWLLLLVIIANLGSLAFFFRTFFRVTRRRSVLIAGVFYAAWVASLPTPGEIIFWLTGAMEYCLSLSTLLILVSLLYRSRRTFWNYLVIGVLAVAIPAQHEIAGMLLCVVLLAGAIIFSARSLPAGQWYFALGMAVVSQAAVMLSPGNAVRSAQEHRHLWDVAHFPMWGAHSFYYGLNWLSYPSLLLAAACILLLSQSESEETDALRTSPRWIGLACVCGMFVILCEFCLVEMASGNWAPNRVVAWFEFVFWIFFTCAVLTGVPELYRVRFAAATKIGVIALFAVTLLGSANYRSALEDLRGPARVWRRIDSDQLNRRAGSVEFQLPVRYPKLSMHQQVTSDPGCWVNTCLANYLHATSVLARDSKEDCPR
jgi:hypothetical protein